MPARKQNSFIKKYSFALYLLGGLFVLWIILEFLGYGFMKGTSVITSSPAPSTQARTFTASEVMGGFTIDIPEGFEVEEKFGTATLKNNLGKTIIISQNGTNSNNLESHLENLEKLNKIKFGNQSSLTVNNLNAKSGFINNQKTYFIYSNYNVYSLSTVESSLFNLLDQIAQSFRLPKD